MPITRMNHFTVLTDDLAATVRFYRDLLGLREGPRPPLGVPGAWLYADSEAILHIVAGRPLPSPRAGVLDHMAFSATNLRDIAARLTAAHVAFSLTRQPQTNLWQLFFYDLNGARVELDFDPNEPAPE
ncbi:MAG: VOC family protein [Myxococcota bacterium]